MKPEGFEKYMTAADLARYFNVDDRTIDRWLEKGRIPEPEQITEAGWRLWSPKQVSDMLSKKLNRRGPVRSER